MALMLNLQRGIRQYDRSVQQDHVWDYQVVPAPQAHRRSGHGHRRSRPHRQSVARKAQAFDMEVIAYDPFLPPAIAENLGVKLVDFDTLLAESDVLSLHMNLTEENYHMFNKEAFMKCKKHPIIVNEGRGPLICDEDLVWALDNGYIRGAALDMVESEDPDLDTCPLVGPRRRAAHPAQRLLLRHVQLSRRKAVHGQRPVLRQRRVRQGQVHPQRRQRLSTLPLVSAGQPISIFFFSTLLSVLFLRFQRIYLLSYQPSSGFQISVSASGLRHGPPGLKTRMYRAPRQVPGAFLRLTLPGGNSKMKRTGGGRPEKGNVFLDRGGVSYGTCKSIFF